MDFRAALTFPFRGQRWLPNLALVAVCMLIPIIGPMVVLGYGVLVMRLLVADLLVQPPQFDFAMFTEHLKRGLPPFVVALIFVPLMFMSIFAMWAASFIGVLLLVNQSVALGIAVILAGFLLGLALMVTTGVALAPLTMKAALEGTIGGAFDWAFAKDFYRRVGWLTLKIQLLLFLLALIMLPIGCVPLIGPAAMQSLIVMMNWNAHAQLYREYLARGGRTLNIPLELFPPPIVYGFPTSPTAPPPPHH